MMDSSSSRQPIDQPSRALATGALSRNLLVEASAGTGKTSVLVGRLVALVLSENARLTEIAAITFTEKAAGELKLRLRQELERTLRSAAGRDPGAEEPLQAAARALEDLELASVGTIHSFCASLLRERPVEAGVDPEFQVLDPLQTELLEEEVRREWLERIMTEEKHPYLLDAALLGLDVAGALHFLCAALNTNRDLLGFLPSPVPLPDPAPVVERLHTACTELAEQVQNHCTNTTDRLVAAMTGLCAEAAALRDAPREEQVAGLIELRLPGRVGNQKNWTSKESLAAARRTVSEFEESRDDFVARWGHAAATQFANLVRTYVDTLARRKQELHVLDFQDLLVRARNLLHDSRPARDYFKARFKHLLIDEFQDTDPLQTEILFFLAEDTDSFAADWEEVRLAPGKLFVVGDPKQSIYRFRRADIELFQRVARRFEGQGERLELSQNFRSAPGIIQLANEVFSSLIQRSEEGDYQPAYVPLASWRQHDPGGGVVLYPPPGQESPPTAGAGRAAEALCLAKFIRRAVGEGEFPVRAADSEETRPLMYGDIALLFRTTTGLAAYEDALRELEIPYQIAGGKRFYARQEVKALVAVLRALDNPADQVALYAALTSPFFGLSDEDLFLYHQTAGPLRYPPAVEDCGPVAEALTILAELHADRNTQPIAVTLRKLFARTKGLELFALKPAGEQRVANLLKIVDSARALQYEGGMVFRRFVVWLRDLEQGQRAEAESPTAEADGNFVSLLTIHKAKGLEFPMVILANPMGMPAADHDNVLVDRASRSLEFGMGRRELHLQTTGFAEARERERRRTKAEEIRLLYVALTRARNWFVLPAGWNKGGLEKARGLLAFLSDHLPRPDEVAPGESSKGWLCYDTSQLGPDPREQPVFRLPLDPEAELTEEAQSVLAEREAWRRARARLLARASQGPTTIRPSTLVAEGSPDPFRPVSESGGAAFGDLVHRLLAAAEGETNVRLLAERWGRAASLPPETIAEACRLVETTLRSSLLERARRARRRWHELPFRLRRDEDEVGGVIDLLFQEGNELVLVDFKTDQVTREHAGAAAQRYSRQVQQYRTAVEQMTGLGVRETLVFFLRPQVVVTL